MKKEIDKAVETFHRIAFGTAKKGRQSISDKQLASFVTVLTELLVARYKNTWYPENPTRGSGYRCLRMNTQCVDPTILESLRKSKINLNNAQRAMELTIWVDPGVVSIRIGEDGSIGTEDVEMEVEPRRDSLSSEDEAYASRTPSPIINPPPAECHVKMSPSKNIIDQSNLVSSPGRVPPNLVPGAIYQQRVSPPSMPNPRLSGRPMNHVMSNSQEFLPSGHIPTSTQSYSRPKTLFPAQDMNANGSNFQGAYRDGMMMSAHQSYHAAMAMRMPRSMHYMDIPAQA